MLLTRKPRRVVRVNSTGLKGGKAGCSPSPSHQGVSGQGYRAHHGEAAKAANYYRTPLCRGAAWIEAGSVNRAKHEAEGSGSYMGWGL